MPVLGITGGIATGKSAFLAQLRERLPSAFYFDADIAARQLTDNDADAQAAIREAFGADIYSASGDLNRARLRTIVFTDPEKKRALEQILHPRIRRQWSLEAEGRRTANELFFADIPLLYETGGEALCDRVVVVACSGAVQLRRLTMRSSLSKTAAAGMIGSQMPLNEKIARADHVVWNNGALDTLAAQTEILARTWCDSQ
ncbi:MAG: dephospho-CoA kinase [Verrucomicrobiota bacterium]|nr:dephospho-CoA kinase [Verrucomicrobiota bacterium]